MFPLWQVERDEYAAACHYLGLTPSDALYARLVDHLAQLPFGVACPAGFARHLARGHLTRFRVARLDLATRLLFPSHPARHLLNAVIALHECDGRGFRELAATPTGAALWPALFASALQLGLNALLTSFWLAAQAAAYALRAPFRREVDLRGKQVLITGVGRGLGRDLMLHCLERGAAVIGVVRTEAASSEITAKLPSAAPLHLIVADLARAGALTAALYDEPIDPTSIDIAIACAGAKFAGSSALSLTELRKTFEVNVFSTAELAHWFCRERGETADTMGRRTALVLISSMGRWHGMVGSGGYNASKAALSIWGESLEMDLRQAASGRIAVTIVEPGLFASGMSRPSGLRRWLFAPRRTVAETIVAGAAAGRRSIRPPFWFALLTWAVCLAGRPLRARLFGRVKTGAESK